MASPNIAQILQAIQGKPYTNRPIPLGPFTRNMGNRQPSPAAGSAGPAVPPYRVPGLRRTGSQAAAPLMRRILAATAGQPQETYADDTISPEAEPSLEELAEEYPRFRYLLRQKKDLQFRRGLRLEREKRLKRSMAGKPRWSEDELRDMETQSRQRMLKQGYQLGARRHRFPIKGPPEPPAYVSPGSTPEGFARVQERKAAREALRAETPVDFEPTEEQALRREETAVARAQRHAQRLSKVHQFAAARKMARDMRMGRPVQMPGFGGGGGGMDQMAQMMMMSGDPRMAAIAASLMQSREGNQAQMQQAQLEAGLSQDALQQQGTLGTMRLEPEMLRAQTGIESARAQLRGLKEETRRWEVEQKGRERSEGMNIFEFLRKQGMTNLSGGRMAGIGGGELTPQQEADLAGADLSKEDLTAALRTLAGNYPNLASDPAQGAQAWAAWKAAGHGQIGLEEVAEEHDPRQWFTGRLYPEYYKEPWSGLSQLAPFGSHAGRKKRARYLPIIEALRRQAGLTNQPTP